MLARILKLYHMAMANDVRSPTPHLVGPPGCGKSTVAQTVADMVGVNLHILNVARLSPLEIEGVQMPHGEGDQMKLRMLHSTLWTQLKEGDIVLLDEFLRGFPEVYNALLDIMTSRQVAGLHIPKVFFLAASNSWATYDGALEDRLLHINVPDPRSDEVAFKQLAQTMVSALNLEPTMLESQEVANVLSALVLPTFSMLDKRGSNVNNTITGMSLRKLIGMTLLREVEDTSVLALLRVNNARAMEKGRAEHVFLVNADEGSSLEAYLSVVPAMLEAGNNQLGTARLTDQQRTIIEQNVELVLLHRELTATEKKGESGRVFID